MVHYFVGFVPRSNRAIVKIFEGGVMKRSRLTRLSVVLATAASLVIAGGVAAQAQDQAGTTSKREQKASTGSGQTGSASTPGESRPYFIEFRSRNAANYGHAFVQFGRNGTKGSIVGLHPAGDRADCVNCSVLPWTIGHLVPVPAEVGPSDGDDEPELYLTARYRVRLTPAEYKKVVAFIRKKQAETKTWNAITNNCVQFIGEIAEYMGLKAPSSIGIFATRVYVNQLAELNGGTPHKMGKLPVALMRDAPASFVRASASAERSAATN
jgi:hypothetical protein